MLHNVSNRRTLSILVALVATNTVLAQVKIKERVEIRPKVPVSMASVEETVLLADDPNPGGPIHVLVVHPCTITASATIDMDHTGGYPSSDLYVKTLVGGSIAWYNGRSYSPPQIGGDPITFKVTCGSVPIKLESTWEGIDIRSTTKTITPSSATILINGMLSGHSYTVTVQLQATNDNSYDLATMDLTADAAELTQCATMTTVHFRAKNYKGTVYNGYSCSGPIVHKVWVESPGNVQLNYLGNWLKQVDYAWGYGDITIGWFYGGETENSTATFKWQIGDRIESKTFDLAIAPSQLKLTYSNDRIGFGDSTIVRVNVLNGDGTLSPVPEGWLVWFETSLSGDKGFLYLPDSTQVGDWIVSTSPTVKFYASSQPYPPDLMVVPIAAMIIKDDGGAPMSVNGGKNRDSIIASKPLLKSILGGQAKGVNVGTRASLFREAAPVAAVEPCNYIFTRDTLVVKKKDKGCPQVTIEPKKLSPGDTALIKIECLTPEGKILAYNAEQQFDITLIEGNRYGTILSTAKADTSVSFEKTQQPFFLIASEDINKDSVRLKVWATPSEPILSSQARMPTKLIALRKSTSTQVKDEARGSVSPIERHSMRRLLENGCAVPEGAVDIVNDKFTVLLGQSKYFYAINEQNILRIKETPSPFEAPPERLSNIEFHIDARDGAQMGIYWDYWYPLYSGNSIVELRELPHGLIRLIGRFWRLGTAFETDLVVTEGTRKRRAKIVIESPKELGNTDFARARRFTKDAENLPTDIDALCITYGGQYGIPPQLVKAQIQEESPYVGDHGVGFAPPYRYEPYTTQFDNWIEDHYDSPFYITEGNIGSPPPPDHWNLKYMQYFKSSTSVWNVIETYSDLGNEPPAVRLFGSKQSDGTMKFVSNKNIVYKEIQKIYDEILNYFLDPRGGSLGRTQPLTLAQAGDSAKSYLVKFLKYSWRGTGTHELTAQTRLASSYGYLQLLYSTAVEDEEYDRMLPPEGLNVTTIGIQMAMGRQNRELLRSLARLGTDFYQSNWGIGYENAFYGLLYPRWNKSTTYWLRVMQNSLEYMPK